MPWTDWGWLVTPGELQSWIVANDDRVLVVNKPGGVVCHPSKHGPWSSLIGACREFLGVERLHMPSRLDRETSGVVVLAKDHATASLLQRAAQHRQVSKTYHAVLCGRLEEQVTVEQAIGRDAGSEIRCRQAVTGEGQAAATEFVPLSHSGGYTLVRVHPRTGRLHQIRVHAAWLGHPVAGDKLYGPDPTLFTEFIEHGLTERHRRVLPLERQALHASVIEFRTEQERFRWEAAMTEDLAGFCQRAGLAK